MIRIPVAQMDDDMIENRGGQLIRNPPAHHGGNECRRSLKSALLEHPAENAGLLLAIAEPTLPDEMKLVRHQPEASRFDALVADVIPNEGYHGTDERDCIVRMTFLQGGKLHWQKIAGLLATFPMMFIVLSSMRNLL